MIHTQKWKHQQLSSMCKVYAHYNTKMNEMKLLYTKVEAASNLPSCARCVRTITTRQTKWNDYTQKWKQQQLAIMCEMCAKWINYTQKWKQQQLASMCEMCVYYNKKANEMK